MNDIKQLINISAECQNLAFEMLKKELNKPMQNQCQSTMDWYNLLYNTPFVATSESKLDGE